MAKKGRKFVRNYTLPIAIGVAIAGCLLAVMANITTNNINEDLKREQYHRMEAERSLQLSQGKIVELTKEVEEANSKIQSIQTILSQGVNKNVVIESESGMAQKESLDDKLKKLEEQLPSHSAVLKSEAAGNP